MLRGSNDGVESFCVNQKQLDSKLFEVDTKLIKKMNALLENFDKEIPIHGDEKTVLEWRKEFFNILKQLKLKILVNQL